jgi:hypothetical protein
MAMNDWLSFVSIVLSPLLDETFDRTAQAVKTLRQQLQADWWPLRR